MREYTKKTNLYLMIAICQQIIVIDIELIHKSNHTYTVIKYRLTKKRRERRPDFIPLCAIPNCHHGYHVEEMAEL